MRRARKYSIPKLIWSWNPICTRPLIKLMSKVHILGKNILMYFSVSIFWSTDFKLNTWSSCGSTRESHDCKIAWYSQCYLTSSIAFNYSIHYVVHISVPTLWFSIPAPLLAIKKIQQRFLLWLFSLEFLLLSFAQVLLKADNLVTEQRWRNAGSIDLQIIKAQLLVGIRVITTVTRTSIDRLRLMSSG